MKKERLVVVGFGRVGSSIAPRFAQAGWRVSVLPRSSASVRRAAQQGLHLADHDDLQRATVCFLAVPDREIAHVAQHISTDLGPKTALVHFSGAMPLSIMRGSPRRPLGSFHPLAAISDGLAVLDGHAVAVAADTEPLRALLTRVANAIGMHPLSVPEENRAMYHAGALIASGLFVALLDASASALTMAGLSREEAIAAILPLANSALQGVVQRGLEGGLTGPVVRGDLAVVEAHLAALPSDLAGIYRLLSQRALALSTTLPKESRQALARILV